MFEGVEYRAYVVRCMHGPVNDPRKYSCKCILMPYYLVYMITEYLCCTTC